MLYRIGLKLIEHIRRHQVGIMLAMIMFMAIGLRLWGINFGLPYVGFQPDEWAMADDGLKFLRKDIELSKLQIGNLHAVLQAAIGGIYFYISGIDPDQVPTFRELRVAQEVSTNVIGMPHVAPGYYLWGRAVVAVMGGITVWLTYLIGRTTDTVRTGLLAALFLAVMPLHAEYSHYLIRTIPGLLTLLLAFFCLQLAYKHNYWWLYLIGGFCAALAILTKQNNLIILAPLGLSLALGLLRTAKRRSVKETILIVGAGILGLAISGLVLVILLGYSSPAALFNNLLNRVWNNDYVFGGTHFGFHGESGIGWIVDYFLHSPWRWVFILSIPGAVIAVVRFRGMGWLLLSIPVPYLLMVSFFTVRFLHWLLPIVPFLAVLAAICFSWIIRWLNKRTAEKYLLRGLLLQVVVLAIMVFPAFYQTVIDDYWFTQKDVRVIASEWLQHNLPPGSNVVIEKYGPYLPTDSFKVQYVRFVTQNTLESYQQDGIKYLVGTQIAFEQIQVEALSPLGDPAAKEYLGRYGVLLQMPLVKEFIGPILRYPDQIIRVYQIN